MIRRIRDFCIENNLLEEGDKVLLGLSGGADSVGLLFALLSLRKEFGLTIEAVHVHHGIRGEEADRDERFCRDLCLVHNVEFGSFHVDVPQIAKESGESLEEAGRRIRYEIFNNVLRERGLDKIAVAHHRNDQAETVLFQMVRGSRLTGLTGIRPKKGNIIRPLLCLDRSEILEYLSTINQDYVTDSTNGENEASRNILRNEVIPRLTEIQKNAVAHICYTADYLKRVDDFLEKETEKLFSQAVQKEGDRMKVDIKTLSSADSLIQEKVIYNLLCDLSGRKKDITHTHVEKALELKGMQTGAKLDLKYGVIGQKVFESLVFTKKNKFDIDNANCNNKDCEAPALKVFVYERGLLEGTREFMERSGGLGKKGFRRILDRDALINAYPDFTESEIVSRCACPADYITAFSDGRRKKVFDLLMEGKVAAEDRGKQQLIAFRDEIFMIKGMRCSENFRVTDNTKSILVIEYTEE